MPRATIAGESLGPVFPQYGRLIGGIFKAVLSSGLLKAGSAGRPRKQQAPGDPGDSPWRHPLVF